MAETARARKFANMVAVEKQLRDGPARRGGNRRRAGSGRMLMQNGFFGWILIGLAAGLLARLALPAGDPGGPVVAILIGIAGALLAGFVADALGWAGAGRWRGCLAAAVGAVALLALYRLVIVRRSP